VLYFRNVPWLCVRGGATCFTAYITVSARKREEVMWSIDLRYVAAGAAWRRVHEWERPSLWIDVDHFQAPAARWSDLEQACYWDLPEPEMSFHDYMMDYESPAGGIEAHYYSRCGTKEDEQLELYEVVWRVAARRGRWFTVEMAALYDGRETQRELREQPVVVTPDGKEEPAETDAEFWKRHATFYLVEEIPFGTVMVRVPRYARDPETYAYSRAQELIGGLPLAQHIEVHQNHDDKEPDPLGLHDDLFVILHFNGYYEL
jgi:hypothetical protein